MIFSIHRKLQVNVTITIAYWYGLNYNLEQGRIQSLERGGAPFWKPVEDQKKKKKKKVMTIIANYPLPTISRLLCKIKPYL